MMIEWALFGTINANGNDNDDENKNINKTND